MKILNLLYVYIVVSIIWPNYIVLKVGSLPGITPDRMIGLVLILVLFLYFTIGRGNYSKLMNYRRIVSILLILSFWNLTGSCIAAEQIGKSIFASINWFVSGPLVFIIVLLFVKDLTDVSKLIKAVVIGMFLVNLLGVVELISGHILFKNYLLTENQFTMSALIEKTRDGMFRIRSVFTNPLIYAQYLIATLPLFFYFLKKYDAISSKFFYLVNIMLTYFLIYHTGSRAGLALGLLIPLVLLYLKLYKYVWLRYILNICSLIFIAYIVLNTIEYIQTNIQDAQNLHSLYVNGKVDSTEASNLARILQLQMGFEALTSHPIFGFGYGEALNAVKPLKSLDNYYLSILLASGIGGLIILLVFISSTIKKGLYGVKKYKDPLLMYILSGFIIIHIYYFILSISKINILVYLFSAIIFLQVNILQKRSEEKMI